MKKALKVLLAAVLLCVWFVPSIKANTYTEEYVINRVAEAEIKTKEIVDDFTNWSNSYSSTVSAILTKDFLNRLTRDYEHDIDLTINELMSKGYNQASIELSNMKTKMLDYINYSKETLNILEVYLEENVEDGVLGSTDLFIQIRSSLKQLKNPVKNLVNIYYDEYYDDLYNKIDSYNNIDELIDLYEKALDKFETYNSLFSKVEDRVDKWQDLFNKYNMQDYEDLFKEEFGDYYSTLKNKLNRLYTKLESKLQNKLDEKISNIVSNTDMSDINSMINRNEKLYDLIDYIEDKKMEINDKFTEVNSYIKINMIKEEMNKYQTKVIDRFNEAIQYTKTYLLDVFDIGLKNAGDSNFININKQSGIIVYDFEDLSSTTFVNKLFTTVGSLNLINTYQNRIGTLSKLRVMYNGSILKEFTIIIKGDINPSGRIDISDVVKLCNKIFGKEDLNMYEAMAADMNNDSNFDITDVVKLCNKMFK